MAAGLGFKTFTTGEVLTAADTNGYLMQGVLVFASSAARAAAITSPQEGQYSYLKDTNSTEYYDGAAWIAAPIGDITGVTAGTGISGGGTSGTVTVTNAMATEITAAGDIIVGTGSGTFDNLPIGTTGQVLTADTTVSPYKVKWAAAGGGGTPFTTDIVVNDVIVGRGAGNLTTNTVVGNAALDSNTTGSNIVAIGLNALTANTAGFQNIAIGANAMLANTDGDENTAVGHNALKTGTGNASCTAIGWGSLEVCSAGDKNTGVGYNSLYNVTTGTRNTGMGGRTGISLTTGITNTILGEAAGQTLSTGSNNTLIGCGSATASSSSSNTVTFGDSSITTLRAQVTSITALSDARDKKNVEPLEVGLDFVNDLKPVKFDWNMRPTTDIDGNEVRGKVDVPDVGFIAQDLVAQEDASGLADYLQLTYRDNPEKLEATQGRLIPILVKAIQELSAKVAALETNA